MCVTLLSGSCGGPILCKLHLASSLPPGCTHFIIGRDMAGCKSSISGNDFYGAYDAQELLMKHSAELGVQVCGQHASMCFKR